MRGKDGVGREHALLYQNRHMAAGIGLLHTFLSAGIVFGWASLYPVLRHEGVFEYEKNRTLSFSTAFTCGAIGNYLSNLPMGALLDSGAPHHRHCGVYFIHGVVSALIQWRVAHR